MSELLIESSQDTPEIEFSSAKGYVRIEGKSLPEDSTRLYEELISALKEYCQSPKDTTSADLKLEYFNTSSSKSILEVLKLLKQIKLSGKEIKINWMFDEEDEEMLEAGQDFSSLINIPFNYIAN